MIIIHEKTFSDAYKYLLDLTLNVPEYITSPRGMLCYEHMDVVLRIDNPLSCLYENIHRSSQYEYIAAELLWYFSGSNLTSDIFPHASFWRHIENSDKTVNSSYGTRLFVDKNKHGHTEWSWALNSLVKDVDTRQAIMRINKPEHSYDTNKDFPCTLSITFHIRENKLNMSVHMRSNDIILGLPTDFAFFAIVQIQMLEHLKQKGLSVELGSYTHKVDSMHLYEKHFTLATNMLESEFEPIVLSDTLDVDLIDVEGIMTNKMYAMWQKFKFKHQIPQSFILNSLQSFIRMHYNSWQEKYSTKLLASSEVI